MKKKLIVLVFLTGIVILSMSFFQPAMRYKNLKVLPKNTTKQEIDSVMKHFTSSLGVKCNFCHVRNDDEKKTWNFASDADEHKGIARNMMRMTAKTNKKYFKGGDLTNTITCYTCHTGKEKPGRFAPAQPRKSN